MTPFMLGLLCALAIGVGATLYFWGLRRRQAESSAGVDSLSAMHWREFAGLILEMLYRRGYTAVDQHPLGSGDHSHILLKRGDGLCLLSCKHGSAYRLGGDAIGELAESVRMNDAAEAILVTPGGFTPEAYIQAKPLRIELIDGKALWPEIAPLLPETLRTRLHGEAATGARRGIGFGWLAAAVVGVAVAWLQPTSGNGTAVATPAATSPSAAPSTAAKASGAAMVKPVAIPTPEQLAQRRVDSATALAALPGIERAAWSTQSTLSLDLGDERADAWGGICGILDRYEELRATRVQLNPPRGSDAPVRFRQCHAY